MLAPGELTVIGNVGDDLEVLGLHVSPDLDSVLYALAGLNDAERGWGRAGETWQALESARAWGGEGWFRLGDLDLGLHLVRTQALRAGEPLSAVTARLAAAAGSRRGSCRRRTTGCARTSSRPPGTFPFQEWFVARGHGTRSTRSSYEGADAARPAPGRARGDRGRRRDRDRARATRTSRSARSSPSPGSARRSRRAACAASPSAR